MRQTIKALKLQVDLHEQKLLVHETELSTKATLEELNNENTDLLEHLQLLENLVLAQGAGVCLQYNSGHYLVELIGKLRLLPTEANSPE